MEEIKEKLVSNRPTLSASSLKTYNSILTNLYKKVFPDTKLDLEKFNNSKKFLTFLKDVDGSKRKTYLSALVVLCPTCDEYKDLMNKDGQEYNAKKKMQKKSEKEEANWVEQSELQTIYENLENEAKACFKLKNPTSVDIQRCQSYIILSVVSGKYIPIRRSLDWTEMKFRNYNKDVDNYLDDKRKNFVFNVYKTHKFLGDQTSPIPTPLKRIITNWLKLLQQVYPDTDYIFVDSRGNKLTPTKLTQRLNNVFGRKASINILRHSFLSEKYKDMPSLEELQNEATAMGHSLTEHIEYIRKDD